MTGGKQGLEVVQILEAATASLRQQGAAVPFAAKELNHKERPLELAPA